MPERPNTPRIPTLRDGSHAMRHRFTEVQVRSVVRALDDAGVEVLEVSHGDGLGSSSFNYGFSGTDEMKPIAAAYGVPAHEILRKPGEAGYVGGQEDMITDVALQLVAERERGATHI
ncbi:hypothetical protein [Streptomyces sp. NBC_00841]|uniref:hypothetical protein n=1 Tax=Streptomyces sp. NBC_00841 TaxID=2975847 RepID=UPI003FA376F0